MNQLARFHIQRSSIRSKLHHQIQSYISTNIETQRLNGRALADKIQSDLTHQLYPALSYHMNGRLLLPGLAVVIVGNRRDSRRYVEKKIEAAQQIGYYSEIHELDEHVTQTKLLDVITSLNNNSCIDGILVQLPLPSHIDADLVIEAIDCNKDVDGLHPTNMGKLAINHRNQAIQSINWIHTHQTMRNMIHHAIHSPDISYEPSHLLHMPCAARACLELLLDQSIDLQGKHCVILGRSPIVGLPLNLMLLQSHATVTNIDQYMSRDRMKILCQSADIIITAVGKARLIDGECLKPGVIILDVGINFVPIDDQHRDHYYHTNQHQHNTTSYEHDNLVNVKDVHDGLMLVGDVDFESCSGIARAISPVPGGIGPLTVAMLMENTAAQFVQRFCQTRRK